LVSLNGEVKKTLSGVVEAADQNSDANSAIAATMEKTLQMAADAQSSFGHSAEQISDTIASTMENMRQLGDGGMGVAAAIRQIQENVASVLKTNADIQHISLETQIIAVNAGVEAARAGDAGLGFGVIAQAMKRLADQVRRFSVDNTTNLNALKG